MQEIRFKPSTVSRRFSVVAGTTRPPSTSGGRPCRRSHPPWDSPTCNSSHAHRQPRVGKHVRLRPGRDARSAWHADLRSHQLQHRRPRRRARPPRPSSLRQRHQSRPDPGCRPPSAAPSTVPSENRANGPILLNTRRTRMDRHAATRRLRPPRPGRRRAHQAYPPAHAAAHLRHDDARRRSRPPRRPDRHADPRTTMRCDRARQNLDRHPNYILAAYMASGTSPGPGARPDTADESELRHRARKRAEFISNRLHRDASTRRLRETHHHVGASELGPRAAQAFALSKVPKEIIMTELI